MKTVFACLICLLSVCNGQAQRLLTGADQLSTLLPLLDGKRVALVVNQTSLCHQTHLLDTLIYNKVKVTKVFAPEHGFRGTADAGEHVSNGLDRKTSTPIVSLYGKNKKPTAQQLADTDIVVFDIQDVGARFYTYVSTLFYLMQSCAENNKKVIVLDRPNPCDYVDGPMRQPRYKSFVSLLPLPVLHGCTVGELAQMMNGEGWLETGVQCRLQVIPVKGWRHGQPYSVPVKPSPNLPNDQAIALYASLCPLEGTSVSVGRGTPYPFQQIGTPLAMKESAYSFQPEPVVGADKHPLHQGQVCHGQDLRKEKAPAGFTLKYIIGCYKAYQRAGRADKFFSRPQLFDLLMGTNSVRMDIQKGKSEEEIRAGWQADLERYRTLRQKYLLY